MNSCKSLCGLAIGVSLGMPVPYSTILCRDSLFASAFPLVNLALGHSLFDRLLLQ